MNPEDYNLTKLTEDLEDLDSIEKFESNVNIMDISGKRVDKK